jgi:hypothetical protein
MADSVEKTFADLGKVKHTWSSIVAHDYVAFTPALLYWGTTLDRDMVRDFASTLDKSTRILGCDSPFPIFDLVNPVRELVVNCGGAVGEKREKIDLSRRLYFCPAALWPDMRNHLRSYCFVDMKNMRFTFSVECPQLTIPDYVRMAEGYVPPGFIKVSSVGVYASDYCCAWDRDSSNPYVRPKAVTLPPSQLAYKDGLLFMESRN